jgi:hypothetical protein
LWGLFRFADDTKNFFRRSDTIGYITAIKSDTIGYIVDIRSDSRGYNTDIIRNDTIGYITAIRSDNLAYITNIRSDTIGYLTAIRICLNKKKILVSFHKLISLQSSSKMCFGLSNFFVIFLSDILFRGFVSGPI